MKPKTWQDIVKERNQNNASKTTSSNSWNDIVKQRGGKIETTTKPTIKKIDIGGAAGKLYKNPDNNFDPQFEKNHPIISKVLKAPGDLINGAADVAHKIPLVGNAMDFLDRGGTVATNSVKTMGANMAPTNAPNSFNNKKQAQTQLKKDLIKPKSTGNKVADIVADIGGKVGSYFITPGGNAGSLGSVGVKAGNMAKNYINREFTNPKVLKILPRLAEGQVAGGTTSILGDLMQGKSAKETLDNAVTGAAAGGFIDLGGAAIGKGLSKLGSKVFKSIKGNLNNLDSELNKLNVDDATKQKVKDEIQNKVSVTIKKERVPEKPITKTLDDRISVITKKERIPQRTIETNDPSIKLQKGDNLENPIVSVITKKTPQNKVEFKNTVLPTNVNTTIKKMPQEGFTFNNTELPNRVSIKTKKIGHAEKVQNEIDSILENSNTWKDKSKLSYKTNTMDRNFEDIIPNKNEAKKVNDVILEPIRKNEADSIRDINNMRDTVKSFGIKAGSKESSLAQKYGEGKITLDELKQSTDKWETIKNTADYMKKTYSELLDRANIALQRNGYKPIPKRANYMPHQGELEPLLKMLGIENPELPTEINGLTGGFKPGKNWFGNALQRKSDATVFDAVRGFDNYIEGVNKLIYHTDDIQRVRALEEGLRKKYNDGTTHLTNLVSELKDYGNLIAGKKSTLDRGAEEIVGRKIYSIVDGARKQLGANMVGGNISSALTNFIPLTQSLATTEKSSFVKGMMDTLANVIKDDGFVAKSDYLTRRFGSDKLALTKWQKVGKGANSIFKTVDSFVSQSITRGKYNELLKKGLSEAEALKEANNYAARIMADRSLGMTPTLYGSKTLAPLTQFQLEIQNQLNWMFKDLPRNSKSKTKLASQLTQLAVYSYAYNTLFEKITGRRPAVDPIGIAQKTIENYNNDNLTKGQANKRLIEDVASQLPFASTVVGGGRIPLNAAIPDFMGMAEGKADTKKELIKPFIYMFPPTGGGQIKKTVEGLSTISKGGAYNNNGTQLKYPVKDSTENKLKAALLGPSALDETNKYYNNAEKPLSEKQTNIFNKQVKSGKDPQETYNKLLNLRKIDSIKSDIKKVLKNTNLTQKEKEEEVKNLRTKLSKLKGR